MKSLGIYFVVGMFGTILSLHAAEAAGVPSRELHTTCGTEEWLPGTLIIEAERNAGDQVIFTSSSCIA